MRVPLIKIAAAIVILLTAAAVEASAQRLKAEVDFDFRIGERVYPAGTYEIEDVNPASPGSIRIANSSAGVGSLVVAMAAQGAPRPNPVLVFRRFGDAWHLTEIFPNTGGWGYAFPSSVGDTKKVEIKMTVAGKIRKSKAKRN